MQYKVDHPGFLIVSFRSMGLLALTGLLTVTGCGEIKLTPKQEHHSRSQKQGELLDSIITDYETVISGATDNAPPQSIDSDLVDDAKTISLALVALKSEQESLADYVDAELERTENIIWTDYLFKTGPMLVGYLSIVVLLSQIWFAWRKDNRETESHLANTSQNAQENQAT